MSMYNLVMGTQPKAAEIGALLTVIGDQVKWTGCRWRDAWVEKLPDEYRIAVYTRNGGGNREHYAVKPPAGPECLCFGCFLGYQVVKHPLYLFDRDDEFDVTYATVYFRLPDDEQLAEALRGIAVEGAVDTDQRWQTAIDAIRKM